MTTALESPFEARLQSATQTLVREALRNAYGTGAIDGYDLLQIQLEGVTAALQHDVVRRELIAVVNQVAAAVLRGK